VTPPKRSVHPLALPAALTLALLLVVSAASASGLVTAPGGEEVAPGLYDRFIDWVDDLIQGLNDRLEGASIIGALGIFFVAGFLTSLTPCVYPIIPIVVAFMGGAGKRSRAHTIGLALLYVAGMAVIYTGLGVLAALLGRPFGTLTQSWWAYGLVSLIIFLFGLSMLGLFEIRLPSRLVGAASGGPREGIVGALFMGATSAIVAAPCAAPVVGVAMVWIGQQGQVGLGAAVMFAFSLGLGLLLVILGISAGMAARAPRSGRWTEYVKKGFGIAMILIALFFAYKAWTI
jgi:thiol:disulfide interchange protein DsbD